MRDDDCVEFLKGILPQLGLRWKGYRKVRGQVCKRVARRIVDLGLESTDAYRERLDRDPDEWSQLEFMTRITISRFYRDHRVFDRIVEDVLPALAKSDRPHLRCWSAGCASGEEPYTLKICWMERVPGAEPMKIVATDVDPQMLDRARRGCYQAGTLKELPDELLVRGFDRDFASETANEPYCVRDRYRSGIRWIEQDIRKEMPEGPFDLILCRNLAFMYFDEEGRTRTLSRLLRVLRTGGGLVVGKHDRIPSHDEIEPWFRSEKIYRKTGSAGARG